MNIAFLITVLGAGALLAWVLAEVVHRRPVIGIALLYSWLAIVVYFIDRPDLFVRNIGGVNVVVPDVIAALVGAVGAMRFLRGFQTLARTLAVPLLLVVVLLAVSYLRGVAHFGVQHATNEMREFIYFITAVVFTLSYPPVQLSAKLLGWGVLGGALLVGIALARLPIVHGFSLEERLVPSYAALAIGQAFFLGWFWLKINPRGKWWSALVFCFLPFSFLLLHRSVWMCLAGGLISLLVLDRSGRRPLARMLLIGGFAAALASVVFLGPRIAEGIKQAAEEATSSHESTFLWRFDGWMALLRPEAGWNGPDLLIGGVMGSGYARVIGHSIVNGAKIESGVIPHNYYVSLLLRVGILGLVAFIVLYSRLLRSLIRVGSWGTPSLLSLCFGVLMVTQLIYYVPYSADAIQGVFLGGALATASANLSGYGSA